jgi:riboflavin kinase/FMN adenylyltransferase
MKVTPLPDAEPLERPRKVAIGSFDGVHLGHREVIRGMDTVLTFDPHPMTVIDPGNEPKLLQSFSIKRDVLAALGIEEMIVIPFDGDFAEKSPEYFIEDILIGQLNVGEVSVGENFRFGSWAKGTPEMLSARPEFETRVLKLVEAEGEIASSSHIRQLVADGDVKQAGEFLGGPFVFEGKVVHGDKRGRELGMPTANIVPDDRFAVPAHGIYAGWARGHRAAINVGVRPTFKTGRGLLIEAYLLDYDGDLYDETLRVTFVERLRGEERFHSVDALVEQMQNDVERVRHLLPLPAE